MDAPEKERRAAIKRTNNKKVFILDEFLGVVPDDFFTKESLRFGGCDLKEEDEERVFPYEEEKLLSAKSEKDRYEIDEEKKEENIVYTGGWKCRKKKRTDSGMWACSKVPGISEYVPRPLMRTKRHPAEHRTQKLCLGVIKKQTPQQEKNTINSILPLYLNATTSFEGEAQKSEFMKISRNFIEKVDGIDCESLTVQQLKGIMKEFGLNYTGKKHELIARIEQTYHKIVQKQEKEGISEIEQCGYAVEKEAEDNHGEERPGSNFLFF